MGSNNDVRHMSTERRPPCGEATRMETYERAEARKVRAMTKKRLLLKATEGHMHNHSSSSLATRRGWVVRSISDRCHA